MELGELIGYSSTEPPARGSEYSSFCYNIYAFLKKPHFLQNHVLNVTALMGKNRTNDSNPRQLFFSMQLVNTNINNNWYREGITWIVQIGSLLWLEAASGMVKMHKSNNVNAVKHFQCTGQPPTQRTLPPRA